MTLTPFSVFTLVTAVVVILPPKPLVGKLLNIAHLSAIHLFHGFWSKRQQEDNFKHYSLLFHLLIVKIILLELIILLLHPLPATLGRGMQRHLDFLLQMNLLIGTR